MDLRDEIISIVSANLNAKVNNLKPIGKGASGSGYLVEIDKEPYKLAVKVSKHTDLIEQEKDMLDYLRPRVCYKVPETYFIATKDGTTFLGMEFLNGKCDSDFSLHFMLRKKALAQDIISKFIATQNNTFDKFGPYKNPCYDTWEEYYFDFFSRIYKYALDKYKNNELNDIIFDAIKTVNDNFNIIFSSKTTTSYLCHGDLWTNNMMIDSKNAKLVGAIDPFNVMYAEPEYELFSLDLCFGKEIKLYQTYKKNKQVSENCDLKMEIYALCNELDWCDRLNQVVNIDYMTTRAKQLIKEFNKLYK